MDSTDVALDRQKWQSLRKMVINLQVPNNTGNFLSGWETVSFSGRTLLQGISKLFSQSFRQLVRDSKLVRQSLIHSVCQSVRQPASQPVGQSSQLHGYLFIYIFIYLFIYLCTEFIAWLVSQSVSHSVSQLVNQLVTQFISQLLCQESFHIKLVFIKNL